METVSLISTVLFLLVTPACAVPTAAQTRRACNSCSKCNGARSMGPVCRCDSNCVMFGDCCESLVDFSTCEADNIAPSATDVNFVCRSIYLDSNIEPLVNESFWMVSSCPSSWATNINSQAVIRDNCVSLALSSSLPPVTDVNTGAVYANEFCAICNGVGNLRAWQPNLACTPYVYEQLGRFQNNIAELLRMDPTIFQTQCQACSYQIPVLNSVSKPRSCFNAISTCLNQTQLETVTRQQLSEESYNTMVDSCAHGRYDLVKALSGSLFRNQYCASCNGVELNTCFTSRGGREGVPDECAPTVPTFEPTTVPTTKPTTVPTTEPSTIPAAKTLAPRPRPFDPDFINEPLEPAGSIPPINIIKPIPPPPPVSNGIPFTITLSNLGGGQVQVSVMTEAVTIMVECPQGEAALGLECRPTLCPAGYVESGGRCAFQVSSNSTTNSSVDCINDLVALNTSDYTLVDNDTLLFNSQMLAILEFDLYGRPLVCIRKSIFFDCPSGLVALNDSDYTNLSNDTVMYNDQVFNVVEYDALNRPIICPPNSTTILRNVTVYSYPEGYLILTYIGCSLSVIGSSLVLLTYGIFKALRTLPSLILMNLAVAILANNLFIIIGGPVTQAFPSAELCTTVAICLHFFFLAQFSWMTIMSFQMAKTFREATRLKTESKREKKIAFAIYFAIGWSVPLVITVISIILDFTTEHLIQYGVLPNGQLGSCWINHFESAIVAFIIPLVLSLVLNMILFVVVTVSICIAARSSAKLEKNHNLHFFRVNTAIFTVTGLTWVFGFIALLAGTSWAWYPFIIANSTQGFVIFLAFLFTKRVLKLYLNLLLCRKPGDSTKAPKSTDSTSGAATHQKTLVHSSTTISISAV